VEGTRSTPLRVQLFIPTTKVYHGQNELAPFKTEGGTDSPKMRVDLWWQQI
jgi:hypothetical protein